jgi:hypothetical protein
VTKPGQTIGNGQSTSQFQFVIVLPHFVFAQCVMEKYLKLSVSVVVRILSSEKVEVVLSELSVKENMVG